MYYQFIRRPNEKDWFYCAKIASMKTYLPRFQNQVSHYSVFRSHQGSYLRCWPSESESAAEDNVQQTKAYFIGKSRES